MVIKPIIFLSKSGKGFLPLTASHPNVSEYHALNHSSVPALQLAELSSGINLRNELLNT